MVVGADADILMLLQKTRKLKCNFFKFESVLLVCYYTVSGQSTDKCVFV